MKNFRIAKKKTNFPEHKGTVLKDFEEEKE